MLCPEVIIHITCCVLQVPYEDVLGKSRKGKLVEARHTAVYFLHLEGHKIARIKQVFNMPWELVNYILKKIEGFIQIGDERNAEVLRLVGEAIEKESKKKNYSDENLHKKNTHPPRGGRH